MELLKLLGIVIVIAGFALKLDSILVILVAAVVTALVGGLGPVTLLETLGSTFVANRSMAICSADDKELLLKLLQNPEMAALLKSLAKTL